MKITFSVILILLLSVVSLSWVYNKFATTKEIKNTPPPGEMVEVNGHNMHVYAEGEGKAAIVFMSGGGTSSPTLDFKPLWSKLSLKHRIVVVEKAGYGWSDVADVSRDIDVILEETRTALKLAGERPPYVLAAHSMSGLEAIYWAQKYPGEVKGIIGLDPAIPESYQVMEMPASFVQSMAAFAARIGLLRLFPSVANSSAAIQSGHLSSDDEDTYRAVFNRRTLTSNMLEEVRQVKKNATKIEKGTIPTETPICFFISDGEEVGINKWQEMLTNYTNKFSNGNYQYLNSGHYVHAWEPALIAKEMETFLTDLK